MLFSEKKHSSPEKKHSSDCQLSALQSGVSFMNINGMYRNYVGYSMDHFLVGGSVNYCGAFFKEKSTGQLEVCFFQEKSTGQLEVCFFSE